ncbi:MAG TPA: hypothetical protein VET26_03920 [Candidatus Sulfotelmatobacter sp.]|nr:hypothetical protein [Candidatus Sulfotelmatobacter sp.]
MAPQDGTQWVVVHVVSLLVINESIRKSLKVEMFKREYERIFDGDENWQRMSAPIAPSYEWDPKWIY